MIDVSVWEWPQYIYLGLIVFGTFSVYHEGHMYLTANQALFASIPCWFLLVMGGFFG